MICSVSINIFVLCPTAQQDFKSLRGRPRGCAAVSSFCPLTSRTQRRRRERRDKEEVEEEEQHEQQQRRRRMREEAERHLLRPRQLSLQVRRTNKVCSSFDHACMSGRGLVCVISIQNLKLLAKASWAKRVKQKCPSRKAFKCLSRSSSN